MKRKFFLASIVLALVIGVNVNAANTADTKWSWNIPLLSLESYTSAREKTDTSPIYFYISSMNKNESSGRLRLVVVNNNGKMFRNWKKFVRYAYGTGKYCLSSNAYEDNGAGVLVKVRGDRQETLHIKASGYWSPDSRTCR